MSFLETQADITLLSILEHNQKENQDILFKLIRQLAAPSELSRPDGFIHASYHLRKKVAAEVLPMDTQFEHLLMEWAQEPEITQDGLSDDPPVPITTSTQTSHQRSYPDVLPLSSVIILARTVKGVMSLGIIGNGRSWIAHKILSTKHGPQARIILRQEDCLSPGPQLAFVVF
ncbi:hypothetical protein BJ165DRAFT_1400046 [Panaeolus papilionaceus]|nr:hypothetical protein BJ165DRAFT_1400046 [Panaeolus papilionaceus]